MNEKIKNRIKKMPGLKDLFGRLDRIEEKLNNIQEQLITQTNAKNDALDVH